MTKETAWDTWVHIYTQFRKQNSGTPGVREKISNPGLKTDQETYIASSSCIDQEIDIKGINWIQ